MSINIRNLTGSRAKQGSAGFARILLTTAATLMFAGDFALAQEAADDDDGGIGEIVVTARKREESILNVPASVTALSGEELDRYALRTIEEISASTPQLIVARGNSGSGATLSLRGIGSTYTSIGVEQSVAVTVDGVYYGQGRIINEGFFDMAQVEILRGPQALFFGKNATAGVLSFTSTNPGSEFEALGRIGYETEAETRVLEGVVSGPLTDTFGLRLAVRSSEMEGGHAQNIAPATDFMTLDVANGFAATFHPTPAPDRDTPQEQDLVGRLTALWEPTDDFSLAFKASGSRYRVNNATWNWETYNCPTGSAQVNPGEICNQDWRIQQNNVPATVADGNELLDRHGGRLYQDYDSYAYTLNADYSTGAVDFSAVTGLHHFENYFLGDYDFTGASNGGTWGAERSEYEAFSTELRAQTTLEQPLNFMVGVLYQSTQLDFNQHVLFPGGLEDSSIDPRLRYVTVEKVSTTDGSTFAAFAQAIWNVTPELELTAGARYTHETKDSVFIQPYVIAPYQLAFVQGVPLEANQRFNDMSPEVALTWRPTQDLTAYIAYKQGFKSGGFSGSALYSVFTTVDDLAFDPERVEGFEGGVRMRLLDNRLRLTLDVYDYDYSDFQVDFFDATRITFVTTNAATVSTRGVELQAEWAPDAIDGLTLQGAVAYSDAKYESYPNAPCYGGQTIAEGCTIVGITPLQDLSGHPTHMAPEWTGMLGANYESGVFSGMVFGVSGNLRYSGDYFLSPFGQPDHVQDSYTALDATLRLRDEHSRWELALIGRNLTDEYILNAAGDAPSSGSGTGTAAGIHSDAVGTFNPGRTLALQFTLRN
ncbi:MAG: TonB-dependent receptor [Hydrogenophilaceae bacterium]|jgi:outer membrane receptor protein involved in Fe transport|nr:TonB-dependent receptor [Hydrogenophilaceae bacterium]